MESTLHALGGILLNGLPTFFLVIFLNFYLKAVFFKPLAATLESRYAATEGAQKAARDAVANAEARIAEYHAALQAARADMYIAQEKLNKEIGDQNAAALAESRKEADRMVRQAESDLAEQAAAARAHLETQANALADEIADQILVRGKAA